MSQTERILEYNGRQFILIGTAHISKESCEEVKKNIIEKQPDCVAIELDADRYKSLNDPESWRNLDIIKVLKKKQGFLLLANLVLSSFQKRMGANVGVKPGDEMRAADATAKELNIPCELVDRPIQTTLRRAWSENSFWGKCKLLSALLASAFGKEEKVSDIEIENLKNRSEMDKMMAELSDYMPTVKRVLIDERDRYLASHIWTAKGNKVLAVLGAGHLPGVEKNLELLSAGKLSSDTGDIDKIPPKTAFAKIAGWIIPGIIIGAIVAGFVFGGIQKGKDMVGTWVIWNGALAGIGTLLALGHPLSILVAIVGAPLTSLCPFVGVGIFTGITQATICKPKVSDLETLVDDISSVKTFYKNRILRVLLVFILSSIGSSIGTFVAGANYISVLSSLGA